MVVKQQAAKPDNKQQTTNTDNIVNDITWVYQNLRALVIRNSNGQKILNPSVLKQAPSRGAIALADFAVSDPKEFFNKFVIKLLPRTVGSDSSDRSKKDESLREKIKRLDPDFSDMKDFFKPNDAD